jgi:hypothetical protein
MFYIVLGLLSYISSFLLNSCVSFENIITAVFAIYFVGLDIGKTSHIIPDLG